MPAQSALLQLATTQNPDEIEIANRRRLIAERVLRESTALREVNFRTINSRDLFELYIHYDDLFFNGELARILDRPDHRLDFRLSSRMTSTGGMTTFHRTGGRHRSGRISGNTPETRHFEIAISTTLLFNSPFDKHSLKVGGLVTRNRLDALQRIFEHELVHLLEMMLWDDSSCAQPRFRSIVKRFFSHVESNHQLLTPEETARSEYGIERGARVQFHYRGALLKGFVNRVNRRATVLVRDDSGELFNDNLRYRRFYVPVERLSRADDTKRTG